MTLFWAFVAAHQLFLAISIARWNRIKTGLPRVAQNRYRATRTTRDSFGRIRADFTRSLMANKLAGVIPAIFHFLAFLLATPVVFDATRDLFLNSSTDALQQVDFFARLA